MFPICLRQGFAYFGSSHKKTTFGIWLVFLYIIYFIEYISLYALKNFDFGLAPSEYAIDVIVYKGVS